MVDFTELDGVGPARSDSLEEHYDSMETLATEDPADVADAAGVPEDTALEFVVQAQNLTPDEEEEDEEVEESEEDDSPDPGELAEMSEEVEEDEEDADADVDADSDVDDESDEEPTYSLTVDLVTDTHYDAYMTALFNAHERRAGSHQPTLDAINHVLDDARYNEGEVEHELTEFELNSLHSAVSRQATDYKGDNMIDHMDAMNELLDQVNDVRAKELF